MGDKKSFLLYYDQADVFNILPDGQAATLIRAIFEFAKTGIVPNLDTPLDALFLQFKQSIERDSENYNAKCRKNAENIAKRWDKKKDTTVYDGKNRNTNYTHNDNDNDNDKKNKTLMRSEADAQSSESLAVKTAAGAGESKPASPSKTLIDQRFNDFWAAYPKKRNKGNAEKAWKALKPSESLLECMLDAILTAKKSPEWLRDGGQYIPYPATWLRAKGWEDDYTSARGEPARKKQEPAATDGFKHYQKPNKALDIYEV